LDLNSNFALDDLLLFFRLVVALLFVYILKQKVLKSFDFKTFGFNLLFHSGIPFGIPPHSAHHFHEVFPPGPCIIFIILLI
jgi:hypothetical protein